MKRFISILLLIFVLVTNFAVNGIASAFTADNGIIITTSDPLCKRNGSGWTESTNAAVYGPLGNNSWWTKDRNATASYDASQLQCGTYMVYIYLTPFGTTAEYMDVTVTAGGQSTTYKVDAMEGGSGNRHWHILGKHYFTGYETDGVVQKINYDSETDGCMRASGVSFVKLADNIILSDGESIVLDTNMDFEKTGTWSESGINLTDAKSYFTTKKGSTARWKLNLGEVKGIELYIPKTSPAASVSEDKGTQFEIYSGGVKTIKTVDFTQGAAEWYSLGTYDFDGSGDEYIEIKKVTESGNTRALGVRISLNDVIQQSDSKSILFGEDIHIFERMGMFLPEKITNEYLDSKITRGDMAVMLTILFGKTADISSENNTNNFSDISDDNSEKNTFAYIKAHPEFGIKGHGRNTFSPLSYASKTELIKFILHQLGYYETTDYKTSDLNSLVASLGINASYDEKLTPRTMSEILLSAFQIPLKNNPDYTFFHKLVRENSGITDPSLFERKPMSKELIAEKKAAKNKERGVIYNNDGNDVYDKYPEYPNDYPVTAGDYKILNSGTADKTFLDKRTTGIEDSQVNTVYYCTGVVNSYTHETSGETDTRKRDWSYLLKEYTGKDTLQTMIDYCDEKNIDVFWSMRMNDTHDYAYEENQLDSWKQANLDKLVARKAGAIFMAYGQRRWSSIDYTHTESRQKLYNILEDTVSRYDVDGIELDFSRFPVFFKEVVEGYEVYPENIEKMNDFMRMIRALTDMYSVKRNKPIIVSIYVPDSIEFCKAIGLDIKTWIDEDLFDISVIGCHMGAFNTWADAISEYNDYTDSNDYERIPVYVACDELNYLYNNYAGDTDDDSEEAKIKKNKYQLWIDLNEAVLAYEAGAKGMYTYNYFNINHERFDLLGSKIDSSEKIERLREEAGFVGTVVKTDTYTTMRKKYNGTYAKNSTEYVKLP